MSYVHEYEIVVREGEPIHFPEAAFYKCRHCDRECSDANDRNLRADPCPERIVQEVVERLKVELQHANVVPGKRRDRPRRLN